MSVFPSVRWLEDRYLKGSYEGPVINAIAPLHWVDTTHKLRVDPFSEIGPGIVTTGVQTFGGVKTFASPPRILGTASLPEHAATLGYVDDVVTRGITRRAEVISFRDIALDPPVDPAEGARYIASANGAGGFVINYIYQRHDSAWEEIIPQEGWAIYVQNGPTFEDQTVIFNDEGQWVGAGHGLEHQSLIGAGTLAHSVIDTRLDQSVSVAATPTWSGITCQYLADPTKYATFAVGSTGTLTISAIANVTTARPVLITNATAASSKITGALIVSGGAGFSGAIYAGAATVDSLTSSGVITFSNATVATSKITGALIVSGGAGFSGAIYAGDATVDSLTTSGDIMGRYSRVAFCGVGTGSSARAGMLRDDSGLIMVGGPTSTFGAVFMASLRRSTFAATFAGTLAGAVGVITGAGVFTNGRYTPTTSTADKLTYTINSDVDPGAVGCVRWRWVSSYNGASHTGTTTWVSLGNSGSNNLLELTQPASGTVLNLVMNGSTGSACTFDTTLPDYSFVLGTEYEFELNYDMALNGVSRLFINGVMHAKLTCTLAQVPAARTVMVIGNTASGNRTPRGAFRDVQIYKTAGHSSDASYTPWLPMCESEAFTDGRITTDALRVVSKLDWTKTASFTVDALGQCAMSGAVINALTKTSGSLVIPGGIGAGGISTLAATRADSVYFTGGTGNPLSRITSGGTYPLQIDPAWDAHSSINDALIAISFRNHREITRGTAARLDTLNYSAVSAAAPITNARWVPAAAGFIEFIVGATADLGLVGTFRFMWTASTLVSGQATTLYDFGSAVGTVNTCSLHLGYPGSIVVRRGAGNSTYVDLQMQSSGSPLVWTGTPGTEYEIQVCYDFNVGGITYFFVNGALLGQETNTTGSATIGARTHLTIGNTNISRMRTVLAGSFRNFLIFPTQTHTASYTAGLSGQGFGSLVVNGRVRGVESISWTNAYDTTKSAYIRIDGTTGALQTDVPILGVTPTADAHLCTKGYADGLVSTLNALPITYSAGILTMAPTTSAGISKPLVVTGTVSASSPTLDAHLTTKAYVDGLVQADGFAATLTGAVVSLNCVITWTKLPRMAIIYFRTGTITATANNALDSGAVLPNTLVPDAVTERHGIYTMNGTSARVAVVGNAINFAKDLAGGFWAIGDTIQIEGSIIYRTAT